MVYLYESKFIEGTIGGLDDRYTFVKKINKTSPKLTVIF